MRLGCTICDARSKIDGATALENRFGSLHDLALRVRHQEQRRRGPQLTKPDAQYNAWMRFGVALHVVNSAVEIAWKRGEDKCNDWPVETD
jgi:hypothetical protein